MSDPFYRPTGPATPRGDLEQVRTMALVVYGCYALGLVLGGLPTLIGIIIAYIKRGDAVGTVYESHFRYAISTFWISILIAVIGFVLTFVLIGWLVLLIGAVWYVWRIVKGALRALDRQPIA